MAASAAAPLLSGNEKSNDKSKRPPELSEAKSARELTWQERCRPFQAFLGQPRFHALLPYLVMVTVLCVACTWGGPWPTAAHTRYTRDVGEVDEVVDWVVRYTGPLLPAIPLWLQLQWLSISDLLTGDILMFPGWKRYCDDWRNGVLDTSTWNNRYATLLMWFAIFAVRLVLFFIIHPFNFWISDHIFLVVSLLSQLSTNLFLAVLVMKAGATAQGTNGGSCFTPSRCAVVVCGVSWILIALLMYESLQTAMHFHTRQSTWTAFVVGIVIFGWIAFKWNLELESAHMRNSQKPDNAVRKRDVPPPPGSKVQKANSEASTHSQGPQVKRQPSMKDRIASALTCFRRSTGE